MLSIVRALLIDPGFIAALHEFATINRDRRFVTGNTAVKVALAPRGLSLGNQAIEFLSVDAVREFRIKLVIAVAIDKKVLLQRLIAVKRFTNVRHRGVKIFVHALEICFAPERVDDCVLRRAMVAARSDEAQNVARAPRGPGVRRERPRLIPDNFDRPEHFDAEINQRLGQHRCRRHQRLQSRLGVNRDLFHLGD